MPTRPSATIPEILDIVLLEETARRIRAETPYKSTRAFPAVSEHELMQARARHMLRGSQAHISAEPGMRRKRVQPRGSRNCMEADCSRTISANKSHCFAHQGAN